jgi:hypothetical protein
MSAETSPTISASPSSVPPPGEVQRGHDGDAVSLEPSGTEPQENIGGWFAASKKDLRHIIEQAPEHAGRNWLIWSFLLMEANRNHALSVTLTRSQIGQATGMHKRSVSYALSELKAARLLTYRHVKDHSTGRNLPASITIKPSISPVGNNKHTGTRLHTESPRATDEGGSVAPLLTRTYRSLGKNTAANAGGLDAPSHSGEEERTSKRSKVVIDWGTP